MNRVRLLAFLLAVSLPTTALAWQDGDESKCPARGTYRNADYRFRVRIPVGLSGCPNSPVGMSDHGVYVPLAGKGVPRSIEAFGAYETFDHATPTAAAVQGVESAREDAAPGTFMAESPRTGRLSGLASARVVVRYTDRETGRAVVRDDTYVLRPAGPGKGGIARAYIVSLVTTPEDYEADRAVFEKVLASWKVF